MSFLVLLHIIPLDAAVVAVPAALGLLSSVSVPVLLEGLGPTKPLVADVALERFLARVGPLMLVLLLFGDEPVITIGALDGLQTVLKVLSVDVALQALLDLGLVGTLVTLELLLRRVNRHLVVNQLLFQGKPLLTLVAGEGPLGLGQVEVLVVLQVRLL